MDIICTIKHRENPSRYIAFVAGQRIARSSSLTETVKLARTSLSLCYTKAGIPINVKMIMPKRTLHYTVSALGIIRYLTPQK